MFKVSSVLLVVCFGILCNTVISQFNGNGANGGIRPRGEQPALALPFSGKCDEKNGRYSVAGQCDAYVECTRGEPEEKLCPDGLVFNDKLKPFAYPCDYPIDVDCGTRTKRQPAQPTEECEHQFGYFATGDRTNCGHYKSCAGGRAYAFECPEGLAFNKETYRCDWADQVADCDADAFLGFKCPEPKLPSFFAFAEQRFYASPTDCARYFVCNDGRPRVYNCGVGNGFNTLTSGCEAAENVTSCPEYGQERVDKSDYPYAKLTKLN